MSCCSFKYPTKGLVLDLDKAINFGILGCGVIAAAHAAVLKELSGAKLIGVADSVIENAESFAKKHGITPCSSYEQMLSDDNIDAICVCTPSYFHEQNAIDAMDHGKHVVLEKPMALTTAACDRIFEKCKSSGKLLTVISQMRFSEDITKVKRLIEENSFGKISICELSMKYYRDPDYYAKSNWRGTLKYDGGGALINQGIHGIDLIQYLLGDISKLHAMTKTSTHKIEAEDTMTAIVEFESGTLGTIIASTCAYPGFDRRIRLHGDRGYVILRENYIEELMINGEKIDVAPIDATIATASSNAVKNITFHKAQFKNFIDAINNGTKIVVDAVEGKRAVDIVERIYRSAKENKQ